MDPSEVDIHLSEDYESEVVSGGPMDFSAKYSSIQMIPSGRASNEEVKKMIPNVTSNEPSNVIIEPKRKNNKKSAVRSAANY
jgi:hypothetical protein